MRRYLFLFGIVALAACSQVSTISSSDEGSRMLNSGIDDTTINLPPPSINLFQAPSVKPGPFAGIYQTYFLTPSQKLSMRGAVDVSNNSNFSSFMLLESNVRRFAASGDHTLMIKEDGSLWTVGKNNWGQLGVGYTSNSIGVAQKIVSSGVQKVWARGNMSFFLKADRSLWAMGDNNDGQMGIGEAANNYYASPVKVCDNVKDVALGMEHVLVLKTNGTLWGAGTNTYYNLGMVYSSVKESSWVQITTNVTSAVVQIDAYRHRSYAILDTGELLYWGYSEGFGVFPAGAPVYVKYANVMATNVKQVSANKGSTMYLKTNGEVYALGFNSNGEFGIGNQTPSPYLPIQTEVQAIFNGYDHAVYQKTDGTYWAAGNNYRKQIADVPDAQIKTLVVLTTPLD